MIRRTSRPAMVPASLVARRCESLKYAGTLDTKVNSWPRGGITNARDNGLLDSLAEFGLGDLLHFSENHGRYFLWAESFFITKVVDFDQRRSVFLDYLEWPVGHIL